MSASQSSLQSSTDPSLYEDLYDLVKFIPSLNLPSGIPSAADANIASGDPQPRRILRQLSPETGTESTLTDKLGCIHRPHLNPASDPPKFRWSETFPIKFLVTKKQRLKAQGRTAMRKRMREIREGGGVGHNVPLEISMFMSCWIADMQRRKTIDVSTVNNLLIPVANLNDALASLERILTTPIPWSCESTRLQAEGGGGALTIPLILTPGAPRPLSRAPT